MQTVIDFIRHWFHPLFEDIKEIKEMASEILTGIQAEDAEIEKLDAQISQVVSDYQAAAQQSLSAYNALEDKYNQLLAQAGAPVDPAELAQEKQAIADSTAKVAAIIARLQPAVDPSSPASAQP